MTTTFKSGVNKGKTTQEVNVKKGKAEYKYSAAQLAEAALSAPHSFMKWATKIINPKKKK